MNHRLYFRDAYEFDLKKEEIYGRSLFKICFFMWNLSTSIRKGVIPNWGFKTIDLRRQG